MSSEYGICALSCVPLRAEPSDKAEIISQLLFGESFIIAEVQGKWTQIQCLWDNYVAWVDSKQIISGISEAEALSTLRSSVVIDPYCIIDLNNFPTLISIASTESTEIIQKYLPNTKIKFNGRAAEMGSKAIDSIEVLAKKWMNTPYLWGGRSIFGIDCSGFVQNVYKMHGIRLQRDAYLQAEQGSLVNFVEEAKPGDLAFFDNDEERIIHVGIVLENQTIIHASGQVRIDRLDHQGIFNSDTKKYSHKLRIIKRIS